MKNGRDIVIGFMEIVNSSITTFSEKKYNKKYIRHLTPEMLQVVGGEHCLPTSIALTVKDFGCF